MSKQKILNSRITQKIDTTANWGQATNFIPLKGEIIYYQDPGQPIRYKVGDGILQSDGTIIGTKVNNLPFANEVVVKTTNIIKSNVETFSLYDYGESYYSDQYSSALLPTCLVSTALDEKAVEFEPIDEDGLILEGSVRILVPAIIEDEGDFYATITLRISEVGGVWVEDASNELGGYVYSDYSGNITFSLYEEEYVESLNLISSIEAGEGISIKANNNNIVISSNIDSSEFATKEELDQKLSKTEEVFAFSLSDRREEWFSPDEDVWPFDEILTISSVEEDGEIEEWDDEYGDYIYETAYRINFEEKDDFSLWCVLYPSDNFTVGTKIIIRGGWYDTAYESYWPDIYRIDEIKLGGSGGIIVVTNEQGQDSYSDYIGEATITFIDTAMGYETVYIDVDDFVQYGSAYIVINNTCIGEIVYTEADMDNPEEDRNGEASGDGWHIIVGPSGEASITIEVPYDEYGNYDGSTLYLATEKIPGGLVEVEKEVNKIKAGTGILFENNDDELTISSNLLQTLENTAIENPTDQAPSALAVADALTKKSEGVNANYNFTTPGWKRVLNIIRATNGNLNLGIAKTTNGKVTQGLGIDFAGYVKFPNEDFRKGKPVIYQRYNNLFGLDPAEYPEKRAQITKVRIGYPTSDYGTNPVNCYVDIYIDFEPRAGQEDYVAFNMSYSGKAASHNTTAIIEETPATDIGMYGETLQYYEFEPKVGPDIYTEGEIEANKFIGDVEADNISAKELFTIGEEARNFNVTGNFADVKVDKSAFSAQIVGEITNMDNGSRDTEGSGDYIVETIEPNDAEGRIIFTDGSYLDIGMITSEAVYQEGINAGDIVRFEDDGYDYWYAYLIKDGTPKDLRAYKKYNYLYNILKTGDTVKNGVTITVHDSGAMTLNGTCTKDTTHALFNGYSNTNPIIYLPVGTYKTYGMRFLMWGINEDKTNYETILPMNSSRNQFLEHRFTITEPKYIGHASIYLKKSVSWNNKSIVPYLYRIDDTEEAIFDYDASTDTITITNDKVNIKITDRGDLYGTSVGGINSLDLDNTTILENGKVVSNNYTTLVADIPAPSYEYHGIAGEWAHGPTNFETGEEYVITDIEWDYSGNHIIRCGDYYFEIDSSQDLNCEIGDIVKYDWTDAGGELYLYYRQANSGSTNEQTFKVEAKTKLVTIGLNADGSIKASESLKQAFKDWLGISDTVVNNLVEQKLDTIAEEESW